MKTSELLKAATELADTFRNDGVHGEEAKIIDALVERIDYRHQKPLTIEEMREMVGKPVWVVCLATDKYTDPPDEWQIVTKSITGIFAVWEEACCLTEKSYGTDWIAYRRPLWNVGEISKDQSY